MKRKVKKINKLYLSVILCFSFYNIFAQTIKLPDDLAYNFTVGSDLILIASSLTKNEIIVIKSDLRDDSIRIKIDSSILRPEKENKPKRIFAGTFQYPGLYKITSYILDIKARPKSFDTVYLYIPSARKSQDDFPNSINSHLSFSSNQNSVKAISTDLKLFGDSVRLVFNTMMNLIPRKVAILNVEKQKVDTVTLRPYNIDSFFYFKVNSFAKDWAKKNIDTGKTLEGCFSIDINTGLTLTNWKADSIEEKKSLDKVMSFRDTCLSNIISLWKEDTLITDATQLKNYLDKWIKASKFSIMADTLCFFKRSDNYIVSDLLRRYLNNQKDDKSIIFFGFADTYFDKLIIAFKLVGPKSLN